MNMTAIYNTLTRQKEPFAPIDLKTCVCTSAA